ncbi:MAG: hypothetical protein DMG35_11320 [Acidobacteria bacterium]|nr:MAG: hypothetical protein DMG35_11320 [Acidobacteriota bacterium]
MFLLERFGILPKETSGMLFAVEMQARDEDQLFRLFLFVKRVAITVPGGRQRFGAVVIEKLLHDLLPAEFAQNVLIELRPIFPKHFLEWRERDARRSFRGFVQFGMQNLLRGDRRFFKYSG